MRVVGLDLSLTAAGVACYVGGGMWTDTIRTTPREYIHDRYDYIVGEVREAARGADFAVIEGLAFDGHDHERKLAALGWMVRQALWAKGIPYALVAPSTLKQYATGDGDADRGVPGKPAMRAAAEQYMPYLSSGQLACMDDNAIDAAWLAAAGRRWSGEPIDGTPAQQWGALQVRQEKRKRNGKTVTVTVGPQWPDLTDRIAA